MCYSPWGREESDMTATEQQQQISDLDYDIEGMCINFVKNKAGRNE